MPRFFNALCISAEILLVLDRSTRGSISTRVTLDPKRT